MARPIKNTVDYFPHSVKRGKTIEILEARFGNDGYAFWFKLLETLATNENHFIDLNDEITLEYLSSKSHISVEQATVMLDLLCTLDAIDKPLWLNHKIVWSVNFTRGVDLVYRKRKIETPQKPGIKVSGTGKYPETGLSDTSCAGNYPEIGFPVPESTQSKVKESKGKTPLNPPGVFGSEIPEGKNDKKKSKSIVEFPSAEIYRIWDPELTDEQFRELLYEDEIIAEHFCLTQDVRFDKNALPTPEFVPAFRAIVREAGFEVVYCDPMCFGCIASFINEDIVQNPEPGSWQGYSAVVKNLKTIVSKRRNKPPMLVKILEKFKAEDHRAGQWLKGETPFSTTFDDYFKFCKEKDKAGGKT
jgi:hypothetical protein